MSWPITVLPPIASGTGTRRIQPAGTDPSSASAGEAPGTTKPSVSAASATSHETFRRVRATTFGRLSTATTVPRIEASAPVGLSCGFMIVVSGWLRVVPGERSAYLDGCRAVIEAARAAPGCLDFSLAADLIDDDRINIFEQWESVDAVEQFRGSGPSDDQQAVITGAHVAQHTVTDTVELS